MDNKLKNAMLIKLKTTKDGIIEEYDNDMIVYGPGRKDNWKVSIVVGEKNEAPLMATINYMMSILRDKLGNDDFQLFYKNMHDVYGDPRIVKVKNQIESIIKNYETKIDLFEHFYYKHMTFSRLCILYYSILHSDRQHPYHIYHQGNFCNNCSFICYEDCKFRKKPFYG